MKRIKTLNIDIAPASKEDLKRILEVERASFSSPWTREMFRSEMEENPYASLLAAWAFGPEPEMEKGLLVGYCCFWVVFEEVHMMNLAVHPDWRRKGIAKRLLEEAVGLWRDLYVQQAHLEVRKSSVEAQKLYGKFGFREVSVRPRYYDRPLEDAILMVLELEAS